MGLDIWMFLGQINAFEAEGTNAVLDRLQGVGINTIVLGDLIIEGKPAYPAHPDLYEGCETTPPAMPAENESGFRILQSALVEAKSRGFRILLHDWGQGAPGCISNPEKRTYGSARSRDVLQSFPQVDGLILDGPEWGYEIEPEHRSDLFRCDCEHCRKLATDLGYDFDLLLAARDRLRAHLQSISQIPSGRRERGLVDGLDLFIADPDLIDWFRFKTDAVESLLKAFAQTARSLDPARLIGCGPRLPAFAPLTGYNFQRLAEIVDFQCPKLYFWQHGVDGLKGTLYRWVQTLCEWNPGLSEPEAFSRVRELFALWIPGVTALDQLDAPLPPAFFTQVVQSEIAKMQERISEVSRIRPWMGLHHGGVRLGSVELENLLQTVVDGGLQSLIYWHYSDMLDSDWEVVKRFAG